jgi:hypothetical protein
MLRIKEMKQEVTVTNMYHYLIVMFFGLVATLGMELDIRFHYNLKQIALTFLWDQVWVFLIWSWYETFMSDKQRFRWYNFQKISEYATKYNNYYKREFKINDMENDSEKVRIEEFDRPTSAVTN